MLTLAGSLTSKQRSGNGLSCGNRGGFVRNNRADHFRSTGFTISLYCSQSGQRLNDWVVNTLMGVGPIITKATDRNEDDVLFQTSHHVFAKAHALDGTRTKVLHHHVGGFEQLLKRLDAFGCFQIYRQRALGTIRGNKGRRNTAPRRPCSAHQVAI